MSGSYRRSSQRRPRGEIGFTPLKRIDATIRGRVTSNGKVLEVTGTGERLPLEGTVAPAETDQLFTGIIELDRDGKKLTKFTISATK